MKQTRIEHLLPEVFRRTALPGTPLYALLQVMADAHAPSEDVLARLDAFFNAYRAPDAFVPVLARWVDMERFLGTEMVAFPSGLGRLRELIAAADELSRWRGTGRGLLRFLETATGVSGFKIDENPTDAEGRRKAFHIVVSVPVEATPYRALIRQIVEAEKPAYVTYDLVWLRANSGEG